ncbi:penicillin-binding transpeptidase domain-containing protein [Desertihabitans aurantiacus]|uniref:penicillin-binding transpeptidase domain-containing protein n=1 Tax=Desertihabitans aurantiacus TaxID=2282477 RepID=UPI0018E4EAFD|nr:penicillin-binding transpeptidase domain-containing protein [Desertihabitans aurantiacus]
MSRARPGRVALAGALALGLSLSGCSLLADRTPPEETLALLADGLQRGDLTAVPVTPETRAEAGRLPQVLEQLDGLRPTVRATPSEQVDRGRTRTRAVVEYTWHPVPEAEPWTYSRDVELVKDAETDWQVVWTPSVLAPGLDPGEVLDTRRVPARRADVLGAGDEPLVRMREVERVGLDKTQVRPERQEDSARELAELLDIDADAFVERVEAAGDQAFVEGLVVRGSETETIEEIRSGAGEIDGARLVPDERPLAPSREFAGPVLGVAGPATEEVVQASEGDLVAGDFAGLTGLQARYDDQLRGTPGTAVVIEPVDPADGAPDADSEDEVLHTVPATDGTPLRLTLDERAQSVADSLLTEVKTPAALVALKPSTGEVLAAASGPAGGGFSNATEGLYPPGSTFKIVSALALLRSGVRPDDTVNCSRTVTVNGRTFENYDDYPSSALGEISFEEAFANSCNTAFIRLWEQVGAEGLQTAAKALGINTDADLGYPFTLGTVPDSDDPVEQAAMMIGQGTVTTNALGVATVAASVSAGHRVTPMLVVDGGENPEEVEQPLTEQEQADLQQLMRAVTTEGSGRFLRDLEGDPVLSKTGTAEHGGGPDEEPGTHGWMVAVQGDLAVAVLVEDGESGSGSAGPLLEEFLRDWR